MKEICTCFWIEAEKESHHWHECGHYNRPNREDFQGGVHISVTLGLLIDHTAAENLSHEFISVGFVVREGHLAHNPHQNVVGKDDECFHEGFSYIPRFLVFASSPL